MKVKLVSSLGLLSLGTITSADVLDTKVEELKKQGFGVKVEEIKQKVYSFEEFEKRKAEENKRIIDEVLRLDNKLKQVNQVGNINNETKKEIEKKNSDIDRENERRTSENARLMKDWMERVRDIKENNKLKEQENLEINAEINKRNEELKKDYEKELARIKKTHSELGADYENQKRDITNVKEKIKRENEERIRQVDQENARRTDFYNKEKARIAKEYEDAMNKYKADKSRIEAENAEILKNNKAAEEKFKADTEAYNRDVEENKRKKEEYVKAVEAAKVEDARKKEEYNKLKEDRDKLEAQNSGDIAKINAENEKIRARNAEKEAKYQTELKKAEATIGLEKYPKKVVSQNLIFKDEPNAESRILTKNVRYITEQAMRENVLNDSVKQGKEQEYLDWYDQRNSYIDLNYISPNTVKTSNDPYKFDYRSKSQKYMENGKYGYLLKVKNNEPVDVEYSNLENTYYGNKKVSKIVYRYTVNTNVNDEGYSIMNISNNPNQTVSVFTIKEGFDKHSSGYESARHEFNSVYRPQDQDYILHLKKDFKTTVDIEMTFYDENGDEIVFDKDKQALLSLSSLGSPRLYSDGTMAEKARFNGEIVEINGSVMKNVNGTLEANYQDYLAFYKSAVNNEYPGFDDKGGSYMYKISGLGVIKPGSKPKLTIETDTSIWFYVSTEINVNGIQSKKPELEPLIPLPKTPNLPELPNQPITSTKVEEPKYKDPKLPEKPTPTEIKPLPIEPVKEKDPILKLITPTPGRPEVPGTPPPVVPNSNRRPVFEPNIPVEYYPEPKKPELLLLLSKPTIPTDSMNATRGSVVVKKYVFEYLNSSQGIGAGVRSLKSKKSAYGNSLILRNLK